MPRFDNYHIEKLYLMSSAGTFDTYLDWSRDGKKLLFFQKFNNQYVQPERQEVMEKLAPRLWHGYCFTYNKGLGARKVYVDANKELEDIMDNEAVKDIPVGFINDLYFMSRTRYPEWTMMTDINIWNVTLTPLEVEGWTNCKKKHMEKNKIIDWKTANWTTYGIRRDILNKSIVCHDEERKTKIHPFLFPKNYLDSVDFCHLLSGELAFAHDNATAMDMNRKCKSYAGYNDIETEGVFINPYTREEVDLLF